MALQVASLFGVLSLDDKNFQQGLKNADGGLKTTADKLKTFGDGVRNTGLLMMGAATPILAFAASAVQSAGESQLAISQLEAVISSTGGAAGVTSEHAQALATTLQGVTRFSDEAVLSGENMLLTFTNIGSKGGIFDAATVTALNMATAFGGDVQQSAIQLGKALNDPINGITALTRVGVTFTEQQKAQIEAMVKSGDVVGAQTVILNELGREFGNSATAAGKTFPGQLDILNNKFDDIKETIVTALIPALGEIVTSVGPIIDKVGAWISQNPELVKNIAIVAAGAFALGGILTILGTAIGLVSGALGILLSPAVLIAAAIAGIIYAADKLYPGGIMKLFTDASVAAAQLAFILKVTLTPVIDWLEKRMEEFTTALLNLYIGLLKFQAGISGVSNVGSGGGPSTAITSGGVGVTANLGKRAGGGPVMAGGSYIVGEQGPELFTPSSSGNISTTGDTAGMMGGFNIYGGVHIHANSEAEGAAGMRGALNAARSKGYSLAT